MKFRSLSVIALTLTFILGACTPLATSTPSDPPPPPVFGEFQPVQVDQAEVEVGVGSPIPVHVIVSGNLPDHCSQVEYTEIKQDGSNFIIKLSATPDMGNLVVDGCIKDPLPFRMSIPLNVIGLPAGDYSVEVNGSRVDFSLETGSSASSPPRVNSALHKEDIQVASVDVEVGEGSSLPVHAIVGFNLPNSCAQLGEIRLLRGGEATFLVRLDLYVMEGEDCQVNSIPSRVEIPLNIVNLSEQTYKVNVNGFIATLELPAP
jgi:hypothetical protein